MANLVRVLLKEAEYVQGVSISFVNYELTVFFKICLEATYYGFLSLLRYRWNINKDSGLFLGPLQILLPILRPMWSKYTFFQGTYFSFKHFGV